MHQTPAFFLANYRLGKTLGNGSFGKVWVLPGSMLGARATQGCVLKNLLANIQVKIAEHVLTQHKVAIKILNKRKIKQQDMEEKGMLSWSVPRLLCPGIGCVKHAGWG